MPQVVYFILLLELILVSYGDIKTQKIPNLWSLINVSLFVLFLFLFPSLYFFKIQTFIYSLVFLIVGFILFLVKIMGAGDVKYLFTMFILIPITNQEIALENLLKSTLIIGSFVFLTNVTKNFQLILTCLNQKRYTDLRSYFGTKFSFAPVILLSWVWLGWDLKIIKM